MARSSDLLDPLVHQAVAAIDAGDVAALERLLAEHPRLLRERLDAPGAWLRDQVGGAEHARDERGEQYAAIAAYLRGKEGRDD